MIQLPGLLKGYILVIFIIALQSKLVDLNRVKQNVNKNNAAEKSVVAAKSTDVPDKDYPMLFDVYMDVKTPAATAAAVVTTASTTTADPSATSNTPAPAVITTSASTTATSVASVVPAASSASSASDASVLSSAPSVSVTASALAASVTSSTPAATTTAAVITTASTTTTVPIVTSNTQAPANISTTASTTATSVASSASDTSVSSSAPTASVTSSAPAASVTSSAPAVSVASSAPTDIAPDKDYPMLFDVYIGGIVPALSPTTPTSVSVSTVNVASTSNTPTPNLVSSTVSSVTSNAVSTASVVSVTSSNTPIVTPTSVPSTVSSVASSAVSTANVVSDTSSNTPIVTLALVPSTVSNVASSAVMSVNSNMVSNLVQKPCSAQTSSLINTPSSIISSIVTNTPPNSTPAFPINTPSTIAPNFVINIPANSANTPGKNDTSNIIFDVEPNFGQNNSPAFPINTPSAAVTSATNFGSNIIFDVEPNFGQNSVTEFTINAPFSVATNFEMNNQPNNANTLGTNDGSNIIFDVEPTFESPISAYIPNNDIFFDIENDPVANFPNYLTTRTTTPAGQFNLVTPETPFTTSIGNTTCICVPPGSCINPVPSDGAGIINVRSMSASKPRNEMLIPAAVNEMQPFDFLNFQIEANPPANIQTCAFGLSRCCRRGSYQCGETYPPPPKSPKSDPGEAPYGAYPWMAALLLKPKDAFIGGGVLIDSRHIITAAHKVANVSVQYLKIRLGEWNAIRNNEPIPPIDLSVSKIVIHNGYTRSNLFNNIAVVTLTNPVALGVVPTIATACLTRDLRFGSNCYVSGWGKTKFSGAFSNVQKHVQVQIKPPKECQQDLQKTILGPSFVFNSKSFICAGGESGRDACTGDGGSPLVCQINKRWAVVGLVAWGIGCGTNNVPGVYVNVPSYLDWIQDVVNAN